MSREAEGTTPASKGLLSSIGPAIITASVVLGPGSILSASKIGWQHEYEFVWVLAAAVLLMIGMTALSARLGVVLDGTPCEEIARRAGRPLAVLTGLSLFLIASCFQFGNNLGVIAAIDPFFDQFLEIAADESRPQLEVALKRVVPVLIIVGLNVLIVVALFGFKALYQPVERTMKFLVALMLVGFAANLVMARPEFLKLLAGLWPDLPEQSAETVLPRWQPAVVRDGKVVLPGKVVDHLLPVVALFATTFSVGGAFYQAYLVRQKGWTREHLRQGLVDSTVGIGILGLLTLMVMVTAAAVLYHSSGVTELNSAADVARGLEPAFGQWAMALFCMGIFAGAFSSFFANAMIGGTVLADGLGLGGHIDQRGPKICTVIALASGMMVAVYVTCTGRNPVNLIIFAQALTVLGLPVLAAMMLWLATRRDLTGERSVPAWMKGVGAVALLVTIFLAIRTATNVWLTLSHS